MDRSIITEITEPGTAIDDLTLGGVSVLAVDFDETLTTDGNVPSPDVDEALCELRSLGVRVILVTGRIVHEVPKVWPSVFDVVDAVVAENGAVLANRSSKTLLYSECDEEIVRRLEEQRLHFLTGESIICCWWKDIDSVRRAVVDRRESLQLLRNKEALMILPFGVSKASGLQAALGDHSTGEIILGIGDAENDHSMFDVCTLTAAVSNAVPSLIARADIRLPFAADAGVCDVVRRVIAAKQH